MSMVFHLPTTKCWTSKNDMIILTVDNTRVEVGADVNGLCNRITKECQI